MKSTYRVNTYSVRELAHFGSSLTKAIMYVIELPEDTGYRQKSSTRLSFRTGARAAPVPPLWRSCAALGASVAEPI